VTAEVAIVGGGPAGAALAVLLARAGKAVVLLEREAGPHDKVCGEFIGCEAADNLAALGLDLPALGAVAIRRVRLAARGAAAEAPLPFPAFSLSRRRLDEALLALAAEAGAEVRRGVRVRGLEPRGRGWRLAIEEAAGLEADTAVLAVGKHDLKGRRRPPGLHPGLVGYKMHLRLAPAQTAAQTAALDGAVELCLFPGGYAGLEPIEDGLANLCLATNAPAAWPRVLDRVLAACPRLAERMAGAQAIWPRPLAIAAIPYGHVARGSDGLWRIGDQAAVIPSFAGDGLGIALHSARAAAAAYLGGLGPAAFQRALAADLGLQVRGAALLSRLLVQGWAQPLAVGLLRRRPRLLSAAASATRIREKALARASFPASGGERGGVSDADGGGVPARGLET
jgi:flavin-dependent dehydrogenase